MKNIFLIIVAIIGYNNICFSQSNNDSTKVDINFLKAPTSTAANLLGISPSEIQSPTDPSAFVASFQNSTSNFTTLPKSFAVDIAPFWFFSGKNRTYSEYNSNKLGDNLKQSFVVSMAYRDSSNALKGYSKNSMIGLGLKFSLARGKSSADSSIKRFNQLANEINDLLASKIDGDANLVKLNDEADALDLADKHVEAAAKRKEAIALEEKLKKELQPAINKINEKHAIKADLKAKESFRKGFKMDIAGGFSYRYPQNNVDSSAFFRGGIWVTSGYDWASEDNSSQWSILGILRGLQNPEQPWADEKGILKGKTGITTGDVGIKASYANVNKHTTAVNVEILYRSILSKQDEKSLIKPSFRAAFNASYEVNKNIVLSLAIGRDFDGSISKSGNVFAFLNLITAFGSGTVISPNK